MARMNRRFGRAMSRTAIAIGLAVLLSWSGSCAAQTVEPGPVRVGDRWSYDIKDDATGDLRYAITVVVVDINESEITTRTIIRGKDRPQTMVFDRDWGRNRRRQLEASPGWDRHQSAVAGWQGVAIGRQRHAPAVGRGIPRLGCRESGGRGAHYYARRHFRYLSGRHHGEAVEHQGSDQVSNVDIRLLVCPQRKPMGEKEDGSALRGPCSRFLHRRAHRIFAKALSTFRAAR